MKRFLALVMVFAIIMTLGSFAYADGDTGSITITNAVKDKWYTIYKIFDLTGLDTDDPTDGEYDTASYTLDADWVDFFIGASATGKDYLIEKTTDNASTYEKYNTLTYNGKTYFIYVGDGTDSTENNVAAFAQAALNYACSYSGGKHATNDGQKKATSDGDLEFSSLNLGYYLVYPEGATDATSSICSLTSTIPSAEITQKSTYPTIVKKINGKDTQSVDVGDELTFTLSTKVPDTTGYDTDDVNKYYFVISDMSIGIDETYGMKDVSIKVDGVAVSSIKKDYSEMGSIEDFYMPDDATWWYGANISEHYGMIAFSGNMVYWQDKIGKPIEISYKLKADKSCYTSKGDDEATLNMVSLLYSDQKGNQSTKSADTKYGWGTAVYDMTNFWSNNIEVTKKDGEGDDANTLPGAKFVLMNSAGKFLKEKTTDKDGNVTDIDWVEVTGSSLTKDKLSVDSATITALTNSSDITVKTSGTDGKLTFNGIADGTYYLVEIEAPEGYNLLDAAVDVAVTGSEATATNMMTFEEITVHISGTAEKDIINKTGTILPSTGGIGTAIFYVIGGIFVLAAVVLFITKRRMSAE